MKKKLKADDQEIPDRGQLNKLTPDELKNILEAHQLWVVSDGKEGARADLQGLNLCQENLSEANLEQALLGRSDLKGANLYKVSLRKSDLSNTNLHNADLRDADLTESTNLQVEQLSGANLSNAKLPKEIDIYNALKNIEDASKNAKKIFTLVILLCVYSWLTMGTTTLSDLITDYPTSRLPIVSIPIHIVSFFIWAPGIILLIYFYFQINMQRLWELLSTMPAVFPDGEPIDRKIYPWLLTGLTKSYFKHLKTNNKVPFGRLQRLLSVASAWFIVPLTFYLFWGNYLYRHEIIGTVWLLILLSISVAFSITSRNFAISTLKRNLKIIRSTAWGYLTFILCFCALLPISIGFIYGFSPNPFPGLAIESASELSAYDVRILVPRILYNITGGNITGVNLIESDLSIKPPNWTGKNIQELDLVKGAHLTGINLRNAIADRCFLVKADLRHSDMQTARFSGADLRKADLSGANLTRAFFWEANLRWADLSWAIFKGANLYHADFQNTTLKFANLQGAVLSKANFKDANLYASSLKNAYLDDANLQGANIELSNLQGAFLIKAHGLTKTQLKKACSFLLAYYDQEFINKLGLSKNHNTSIFSKNLKGANLQGAILAGADLSGFNLENANLRGAMLSAYIPHEPLFQMTTLQGANLKNADLRGADFNRANLKNVNLEGAKLNKANLSHADLTGATSLTQKQIDSAIIDEKTKLP